MSYISFVSSELRFISLYISNSRVCFVAVLNSAAKDVTEYYLLLYGRSEFVYNLKSFSIFIYEMKKSKDFRVSYTSFYEKNKKKTKNETFFIVQGELYNMFKLNVLYTPNNIALLYTELRIYGLMCIIITLLLMFG